MAFLKKKKKRRQEKNTRRLNCGNGRITRSGIFLKKNYSEYSEKSGIHSF